MGARLGPERLATGIARFDEIVGGLPRERTTLLLGGPGAGKTVFALQVLVNRARLEGETSVFVAFEEDPRQLILNAAGFDWGLETLHEQERVVILDARLSPDIVQSGRFDLAGLLAAIRAKAEATGSRQIVLDGVDSLLALLDDPVAERRELYRIQRWLCENDLTGMLTGKAAPDEATAAEGYRYLPFMADCVILLRQEFRDGARVRGLRVLKYRGAALLTSDIPIVISADGLEVAETSEDGSARETFEMTERRRRDLELAELEKMRHIEALRRELAEHEAEAAALSREREEFDQRRSGARPASMLERGAAGDR